MAATLKTLAEVRAVLRYWLGAVGVEEALASRPRAQRPSKRAGTVSILEPSGGQPYFRLGAEHAAFIVRGQGEVTLPVDGPVLAFFEHWLRAAYRREALAARYEQKLDDGATRWVVGWPAVHFERREELASILRAPVELGWRLGGAPWRAPSFAERKARKLPGLPDEVVVRAVKVEEDAGAPVLLDRELLGRTLGVPEDALEALERAARGADAERVARAVLGALLADPAEGAPPPDRADGAGAAAATAEALFAALVQAARARLVEGVSAYPTALVQDGALSSATYHLQRELLGLLALEEEVPMAEGTALWSYLTGRPLRPGWSELRGRFRARGLTTSQRDAAEHALGSTLAAVQGPPGTGKTELLLNLAAHAVVARAEGLADGRPMDATVLVVASTNNRAVDNVIDPLSRELAATRLPLALRTGSQEITLSATREALERARRWLAAQPDEGAHPRLQAALEDFGRARGAHDARARARVLRVARRARVAELEARLADLGPAPAPVADAAPADAARLREVLEGFAEALERLGSSARRLGTKQLAKLEAGWAERGAPLYAALAALDPDTASALSLPPDEWATASASERREAWQTVLEEAEEVVLERLAELESSGPSPDEGGGSRQRLAAELAALRALDGQAGDAGLDEGVDPGSEALAHALYLAAAEVRERWAVANRAELVLALEAALEAAKGDRSLRRFLEEDRRSRVALLRLYPVLGCTLLSLGNVFSDEPGAIDRLVIDEAGQCHPAYALSGLLRARQALLVGDVHQLPPVVQLAEPDELRVQKRAKVRVPASSFGPYRVHATSQGSAQALADRAVLVRPSLTDHFRCQPPIIALSDALAGYGLTVHTPPRSLSAVAERLHAPVLFGAVEGAQARARGSWANEAEARAVVELVLELGRAGVPWGEIGVLTPYVGQLDRLRALLRARGVPLEASAELASATLELFRATGEGEALSVGTVHRFQGGERRVVLLSTVLTERRSLGFLDDRPNLLNVAVSRAREHLVIFGAPRTLAEGRYTRLLVERARPMALDGL